MTALRIGVVGTGALGRHHVRILASLEGAELVGIHDIRAEVAAELAAQHGTTPFASWQELAGEVEAMVVAVPTVSHAEIGCELLERGIHVLVEKPIAIDLGEADRLLAAAGDRVLAVGHVEFYNPAVQALLRVDLPPRYIIVERLAQFTPRSLDIDVVRDLMIHDLQIVHALDASPVREVRAIGIDALSARVDLANTRLELESGCVVNLTASRVSPDRVRQLRVFFPNRYYSLDYGAQTIKGFRLEKQSGVALPGAVAGRQILPELLPVESAEPLRCELECFVARCRGLEGPIVTGSEGRRALATALDVAEAVERATVHDA